MRGGRFFEFAGVMPRFFEVVDLSPPGHVAEMYGVQADYRGAKRVVAMSHYARDANDIARILGGRLGVPFNQTAESPPAAVRQARPSVDD